MQYDAGNVSSPNTIVAPITHSDSQLPIVIPVGTQLDASGNVNLEGHVLLGNIVCVSKARIGDRITKLTPQEMDNIDRAVAISLDIKRHYDRLNNIHKDKLEYIEKLKNKVDRLECEISERDAKLKLVKDLQEEFGIKDWESLERLIRLASRELRVASSKKVLESIILLSPENFRNRLI